MLLWKRLTNILPSVRKQQVIKGSLLPLINLVLSSILSNSLTFILQISPFKSKIITKNLPLSKNAILKTLWWFWLTCLALMKLPLTTISPLNLSSHLVSRYLSPEHLSVLMWYHLTVSLEAQFCMTTITCSESKDSSVEMMFRLVRITFFLVKFLKVFLKLFKLIVPSKSSENWEFLDSVL